MKLDFFYFIYDGKILCNVDKEKKKYTVESVEKCKRKRKP